MFQKDPSSHIQKIFKERVFPESKSSISIEEGDSSTELLERSPKDNIPSIEIIMRYDGSILSLYYKFGKKPICNHNDEFLCRHTARRIKLESKYLRCLKRLVEIDNHWMENHWIDNILEYTTKKPYLNIQEKNDKITLDHTTNPIETIYNIPLTDGIEISSPERFFTHGQCTLSCISKSINDFRGCNAIYYRFNIDGDCYQTSDISGRLIFQGN